MSIFDFKYYSSECQDKGCQHLVLIKALEESVKLQSHYAELLNMYDGGKRMTFTAASWLERVNR